MRLIPHTLPEALTQQELLWAYNGLDCCITSEVWHRLQEDLDDCTRQTYAFSRSMLRPALDMMGRGILIDGRARQSAIARLEAQELRYEGWFNQLTQVLCDRSLNPRSSLQLQELFYKVLKLPEVWTSQKGQRKLSMNRETLEKLQEHFIAEPLVALALACKDARKQLGFVRTALDPDGRMHCTYNVVGTETGRWSSYRSSYDTGTNLQNLPSSIRDMFIADPGYKLCYLDLQQAESRATGALAWAVTGLRSYLSACESGDLHTTVAKMVWPKLEWPGDNEGDREVAERPFYRWFDYRYMCKKLGHGSNYYGKPFTLAKQAKIPKSLCEDFQGKYFRAFPEIPRYHLWVAQELQLRQQLTTPYGRRRIFFGRPNDDATLREAIAYNPQSVVGDCLNKGMAQLLASDLPIQLLAQVHDAILFQYPEGLETEVLAAVPKMVEAPFTVSYKGQDEVISIPCDMEVGWNWRKHDKKKNPNPDSLMKWHGKDARKRNYDPTSLSSLLDQTV